MIRYAQRLQTVLNKSSRLARSLSHAADTLPEEESFDDIRTKHISQEMLDTQTKIGCVKLPTHIEEAIAEIVKGYPRKHLKEDTAEMNNILKPRTEPKADEMRQVRPSIQYGEREAMAYLASFFPSMYACNVRVYTELKRRVPNFSPNRILDYGTGPGTSILALHEVFRNAVQSASKILAIDSSDAMLEMAGALTSSLNLDEKAIIAQRSLPFSDEQQFDLVTASYSLGETLSDSSRETMLQHLWSLTQDILVLIEPGTPEGFRQLSRARSLLLNQSDRVVSDAHIIAPCSHDKKCPILSQSYSAYAWCHFIQRVEKTAIHREMTTNHSSFDDEKFTYLIVRRGKRPEQKEHPIIIPEQYAKLHQNISESDIKSTNFSTQLANKPKQQEIVADLSSNNYLPRLIRRPLIRSGHVLLDLCTSQGILERRIISKSHGIAYRDARNAFWGDLWPHPIRMSKSKMKKTAADKQ